MDIQQSEIQHSIAASPLRQVLQRLHGSLAGDRSGKLASYIPELAAVDPEPFGIVLVTIDGAVYEVGDSERHFTIQSISKPFTYGYTLRQCGVATVLEKVGVEPTGDAFNSISLEPGSGRPRNPMVNAGAIAICGLVHGVHGPGAFHNVLDHMSAFSEGPLRLEEKVYRSEKATGHRNRAMAHLLRNFNILDGDPEDALDLYFRLCSVAVSCRDLAVMGATLAHNGVNPLTGAVALDPANVRRVLSVMASCGMYDASGAWLYDVGMPAKSGVGGGVLAVLPGQFGLAVYSPRLDEHGNSVRGIGLVKAFSEEFQLHLFHGERGLPGAIRARYNGAALGSRSERNEAETAVLEAHGDRIEVFELKGRLSFGSVELLVREIGAAPVRDPGYSIIDLLRVASIDDAATTLFAEACLKWSSEQRQVLFTAAGRVDDFRQRLEQQLQGELAPAELEQLFRFADTDAALEWTETAVLRAYGIVRDPYAEVPLSGQELLRRFSAEELIVIEKLARPVRFRQGSAILSTSGEAEGGGDRVFFLCSGKVSVSLPTTSAAAGAAPRMRLSVLWPGSAFGEIAMIDGDTRSADATADTEVLCRSLSLQDLQRLPAEMQLKLAQGLAQVLARRLRRVNREFQALS
jgi:glutaminase